MSEDYAIKSQVDHLPFEETATLPAVITLPDAATLLQWSENSVRTRCREGRFPGSFKLGQQWRVITADLVAAIRTGSIS